MDVYKEAVEPCNRYKEGICAEEGEGISIIKRREGGSVQVHIRIVEKRVH